MEIGQLPSTRIARFAFLAAVLLLLVLKYRLLPLININWDEFRFLSRIYELKRGELGSAFQTFHVELFRWLARVPGNEADQVIAGRTFAFALRLASSYLIFLIGKRLFGVTGALLAVLASLGFSHLMRHGEAFRADPIIACLFLATASLLILRMSSPFAVALSAVALAMAGLVSIKSALYLPSVALIFAAHLTTPGRGLVLRRFGLFCAVGLVAYLGLQTLHAAALPAAGVDAAPAAASLAARIGRSVLGEAPFYDALVETVRLDQGFWLILVAGSAIALTEALRGAGEVRRHGIILLGFLLPLGALFLYRNTFAYFYATVIPVAALVSGVVPARVERWLRRRPVLAGPVLIGLGIPLALTGWRCYTLLNVDTVAPQRRVLEAVWEVFPNAVPYIDRCSMVAAYPKVGPFMSTFVLSGYRARGASIMPALVRERQPVFVLANVEGLQLALPWEVAEKSPHRLLRQDFEYLKAHYVHHWGPLWVAGADLAVGAVGAVEFELPVAGPYTVETRGSVELDGQPVENGAAVRLEAGPHSVRSPDTPKPVTLRYGDHLPRPVGPPPDGPLFLDLGFRDVELRAGTTLMRLEGTVP
jgi:hypothetical protein